MFVINELERLLHNVLPDGAGSRNDPNFRSTLPALDSVQLDHLRIFDRVRLRQIELKNELNDSLIQPFDLERYLSEQSYLTTDLLFAINFKAQVLDRLATLPERPYPAARLLICDQESYQSFVKFQYFTQKLDQHNGSSIHHKFILHKRPFGLSAVVLLSDVLDLLNQVNRPIAKVGPNATASLDYSIIRQIFPYLRITDLIVVMNQIGNLRIHTFTVNGTRSHQIIQFLTHFARSSHLIELQAMQAKLGCPHIVHDNVAILKPSPVAPSLAPSHATKTINTDPAPADRGYPAKLRVNPHLELTLMQLAHLAQRLHNLLGQLEWRLESITFRAGDPDGFSKIFSQILESLARSSASQKSQPLSDLANSKNLSIVPVRVLVLDRFFDLHGLLRHSDRYGPFLEQESEQQVRADLRLDQVDPIDQVLYGERLTEVLKTILSLSASSGMIPKSRSSNPRSQASEMNSISSQGAIRRHLDAVKLIYNSMSEGYLLLLKLESCLAGIADRLRNLADEPMSEREEDGLVARLKRNAYVLKQLIGLSSASIRPTDALRAALIWIDTVNIFCYLQFNQRGLSHESLQKIKINLLTSRELRTTKIVQKSFSTDNEMPSEPERGGDKTKKRADRHNLSLADYLEDFDKISRNRCGNRAAATLEEIVEAFYTRKLRSNAYSTLKMPPMGNGLVKSVSRNKIVVLVLGSVSYDELARIKLLESQLMKRRRSSQPAQQIPTQGRPARTSARYSGDILTVASGLIRPEDFVESLCS